MEKGPIFVVGMHRSGIGFLTKILEQLDELQIVHDAELEAMIFDAVLNNKRKQETLAIYDQLIETNEKRIVHGCYPNVWRARRLHMQYPNAKFLCLIRDPFSGIKSMLAQKETEHMLYGKNWSNYPVPNDFLGVDGRFLSDPMNHNKTYKDFTLYERCALRWAMHVKQIATLAASSKKTFIPVQFEKLLFTPERHMKHIARLAELDTVPIVENIDEHVIDKGETFDKKEREQIKRVIMDYFLYVGDIDERLFPIKMYFTEPENATFTLKTP